MNHKQFLQKWSGCVACQLHKGRKNMVFHRGNIPAELVLMGEAPGAEEDSQGLPFVGKSGLILDQILDQVQFKLRSCEIVDELVEEALHGPTDPGLLEKETRDESPQLRFCVINTVACRPPLNRNPDTEELDACEPRVRDFLSMMGPSYCLVGVGKTAQEFIESRLKDVTGNGMIQYLKIYHPAYLLRQGRNKMVPYILESSSMIVNAILKGRRDATG